MFRDSYRNTTPEEYAPAIAPEPMPLLKTRAAGRPYSEMRVMQHAPDRITVSIQTQGAGCTFHIDRETLDAWGELLFRASEDAPRPEAE